MKKETKARKYAVDKARYTFKDTPFINVISGKIIGWYRDGLAKAERKAK